MKKIIIILVLILVCVAFGSDPNSIPTITAPGVVYEKINDTEMKIVTITLVRVSKSSLLKEKAKEIAIKDRHLELAAEANGRIVIIDTKLAVFE